MEIVVLCIVFYLCGVSLMSFWLVNWIEFLMIVLWGSRLSSVRVVRFLFELFLLVMLMILLGLMCRLRCLIICMGLDGEGSDICRFLIFNSGLVFWDGVFIALFCCEG